MSVKIIPSVLARRKNDFDRLFLQAAKLSDVVHLDLATKPFVSASSVWPTKLPKLKKQPKIEVHAMTGQLAKLKQLIRHIKVQRVYLPVENGRSLSPYISWLQKEKIAIGLAINPGTAIKKLNPWRSDIKSVLVLSVKPGRYGAPYVKSTGQRIRDIKRAWPKLMITCDGGMNERTIKTVIAAGAQRIIIGSAIMLSPSPQQSWIRLKRLTKT
jgi:ribulose-phosphate 3-epimerase